MKQSLTLNAWGRLSQTEKMRQREACAKSEMSTTAACMWGLGDSVQEIRTVASGKGQKMRCFREAVCIPLWTDSLGQTLMLGKTEGGEEDDRGCDGWMASPTQWTWVWASSGSWWWTGKPGVLQSTGSQRLGHDWVTKLNWGSPWWDTEGLYGEKGKDRYCILQRLLWLHAESAAERGKTRRR